MSREFFEKIFINLQIPVIVCRMSKSFPLVYINSSAQMTFCPSLAVDIASGKKTADYLSDVVKFSAKSVLDGIEDTLERFGMVADLKTSIINHESKVVSVLITAGTMTTETGDYCIFFIRPNAEQDADIRNILPMIMEISHNSDSTDDAINRILSFLGEFLKVSRVYIFEDDGEYTRNTYEWCGEGTEPAKDKLQCLRKADYNYDVIMREGMYVTDDVRNLPESDRIILEKQGIKAIAIIALRRTEPYVGYIGFDDCENYRVWLSEEMEALTKTSAIIVSLIERRKTEERAARSLEILRIISDSLDSIVYVNSIKEHEVIFVNKALANMLGTAPEDIIGKKCWEALQHGQDKPCDFCPMNKMLDSEGNVIADTYVWEFKNTISNKWFLIKDAIIEWIDGSYVHIETATEITRRKEHEEKLEQSASMDKMTGAYNREWGRMLMDDRIMRLNASSPPESLCFIDLDGLKNANDTFGHDTGDDMLITFTRIVRSCVRKGDILCRWGGDEFILLIDCDNQRAEEIMGIINKRIDRLNLGGSKKYKLAFSYGIVEISGEICAMTPDSIIAAADKLMYENKMSKRK